MRTKNVKESTLKCSTLAFLVNHKILGSATMVASIKRNFWRFYDEMG
jgi:hypothetical protein